MNKTWQLRAFALYLGVLAPLAASCAKEANTLEPLDEDDDTGGSSSAGSSSQAGTTGKAGTTNSAFGGTGGKSGSGTAGTTTMPDGGEPAADGGEGTGTGGSAGSSGGGGSSGSGGSGGTAGVPPDVLANASVVLHYLTDKTTASTSVIFMKMFIENKSDDALPMADVKVRYWFTSEGASPQLATDHQGGNISGATNTFVLDAANSHVLITFSGKSIAKGADLNANEFQLRIQGGTQDQSNDWSWQPAYTTRKPHDKVTVYLADKLIWGCEPSGKCFDDEGGAGGADGAGGMPSAGGADGAGGIPGAGGAD